MDTAARCSNVGVLQRNVTLSSSGCTTGVQYSYLENGKLLSSEVGVVVQILVK
jgi:hypothetical protein